MPIRTRSQTEKVSCRRGRYTDMRATTKNIKTNEKSISLFSLIIRACRVYINCAKVQNRAHSRQLPCVNSRQLPCVNSRQLPCVNCRQLPCVNCRQLPWLYSFNRFHSFIFLVPFALFISSKVVVIDVL